MIASCLAGCAGDTGNAYFADAKAEDHTLQKSGASELRLYTVISKRNGSGAHSGLLIATPTERILFDPAGTFTLPNVQERGDVHFGVTPSVLSTYIDYHARETYDVVEQRLRVTLEQADAVARLAKSHRTAGKAECAVSINRILRQVSGFETMRLTYFPNVTRDRFAKLPRVKTKIFTDTDTDWNAQVLKVVVR